MLKLKSYTYVILFFLILTSCGKNSAKNSSTLEEGEKATVDTILTEVDDLEDDYSSDENLEDLSVHEIYLPKIDSIIALFGDIDNKSKWRSTKNFQNIELVESTDGNELLYFEGDSYVKYRLNVFGEMGKTEEIFYLINNDLILYSHTEIRYNAPFTADSTSLLEGMDVFDENKSELSIEDSYFKNGKIEYHACQDCGLGATDKEYLNSVEENVRIKLAKFKKLVK